MTKKIIPIPYRPFSQVLSELRTNLKLTRKQVSELTGVSSTHLWRLETPNQRYVQSATFATCKRIYEGLRERINAHNSRISIENMNRESNAMYARNSIKKK